MSHSRGPQNPQQGGVILWLLVLLLLALVLGALYLLRAPLLRGFAEWWIVDDPPEPAQAIVVLGGDNFAADRIRHAAALYRAGRAPRIVLSGTRKRPYFSEADLMERDALALGLPREHLIVARHDAHSTLEEALALRAVLAQHNFRKVIVLTSNFHTRRARTVFRTVYQRQGTQVLVSAAPDSNFPPERWWEEREAWELLLLELLKTVYTWWELSHLPADLSRALTREAQRVQATAPSASLFLLVMLVPLCGRNIPVEKLPGSRTRAGTRGRTDGGPSPRSG